MDLGDYTEMANEKEKPVKLDIKSLGELNFDGPQAKMDLGADAWAYPPPPKKGAYKVKWFVGQDGFEAFLVNKNDPNTLFIAGTIEGRIAEGEYEGTPCSAYLTTRVFRGKDISTMAGFVVAAGGRALIEQRNAYSPKALAQLCTDILKQKEPEVKAECDWRGGYTYKNAQGGDEFENTHNKYEDFPWDKDKNRRSHVASHLDRKTGITHDIRAQLRITRFFGKNDQLPDYSHIDDNKDTVGGMAGLAPVGLPNMATNGAPAPQLQFAPPAQAPVVNQMPQGPQFVQPQTQAPSGGVQLSAGDLNLDLS